MSTETGKRLKAARERLQLTQQLAAGCVGVRRETWVGWENGAPVASKHRSNIERHFGVRFDLVSDDEAPVLDAARTVLDGRSDR